MMTECEFMDLEFKGPNYTWSNNQKGSNNIRIRLDRAMANVDWHNLFPLAQVVHELRVASNHCPVVIHSRIPLNRVPYSFKFESKWTTHPECKELITKEWEVHQRGSDMFSLVQKLKRCKEALVKWSKVVFGKDKMRLKQL